MISSALGLYNELYLGGWGTSGLAKCRLCIFLDRKLVLFCNKSRILYSERKVKDYLKYACNCWCYYSRHVGSWRQSVPRFEAKEGIPLDGGCREASDEATNKQWQGTAFFIFAKEWICGSGRGDQPGHVFDQEGASPFRATTKPLPAAWRKS